MSTSEESLFDKIRADLNKSGFITELKAANIAKSKKWRIRFNSNYLDLDTGKSREFDLELSKPFGNYPNFILHIQLNIEVKKTKKPWIIFIEDVTYKDAFEIRPGFGIINAFDNFSTIEVLDMEGLMDGYMRLGKNYIGRNFCEAFKDPGQPSKIFESLISISKASLYSRELNMMPWAREQEDDPTRHYKPEMPCSFHIIQPIVILEGKLIAAKLTDEEHVDLSESNYIPIETEYTSDKYEDKHFYPDIITLEYFKEYLDKVENWGKRIVKNAKR